MIVILTITEDPIWCRVCFVIIVMSMNLLSSLLVSLGWLGGLVGWMDGWMDGCCVGWSLHSRSTQTLTHSHTSTNALKFKSIQINPIEFQTRQRTRESQKKTHTSLLLCWHCYTVRPYLVVALCCGCCCTAPLLMDGSPPFVLCRPF